MLLRTWENSFDWKAFGVLVFFACYEIVIVASIMVTFKVAQMAGMNIGISVALWSIGPFFIAITDWVIYGQGLRCFQIVGMLALMAMAIMVSLSDVFFPDEEEAGEDADVGVSKKIPVFYAVLISLLVPVLGTFFVLVVKYADKVLRLDSTDFSVGYWLIVSIVLSVI